MGRRVSQRLQSSRSAAPDLPDSFKRLSETGRSNERDARFAIGPVASSAECTPADLEAGALGFIRV